MKRLARVASSFVHGGVADAAKIVKDRALRNADDLPIEQVIDERLLRLAGVGEETDLRRGALGEDLGEEAELREAGRGIARVVFLGLRPERHEARIVMSEVREVGRGLDGHFVPSGAKG